VANGPNIFQMLLVDNDDDNDDVFRHACLIAQVYFLKKSGSSHV